jgi:hypothetical protein
LEQSWTSSLIRSASYQTWCWTGQAQAVASGSEIGPVTQGPIGDHDMTAIATRQAGLIAELKGQHMLIDTNASLFDALPPAAPRLSPRNPPWRSLRTGPFKQKGPRLRALLS